MKQVYFKIFMNAFLLLIFLTKLVHAQIQTEAKSAILIDTNTGRVLYEKNIDAPIPPASMSKMMTIYVIFDALRKGEIKITDKFYISENAWRQEGSRMFLKPNDRVSIENLLKGAIIQSGNDACVALAEGLSGSVEGFVMQMNMMAKKLNLTNSSFANPTGLPNENHYMSVKDLALLGRALVQDFPEYYKLYSERKFSWNNITQGNRNPLLGYFPGADGIKTGHTNEAGYCLVGSAQRDNMRLISVVAGLDSNSSRKKESAKILGYGFSTFETLTVKKDFEIIKLPVYMGANDYADAILKQDLHVLINKVNIDAIKTHINYQSPLIAPIKKGDIIGNISITLPNQKMPIVKPIFAKQNIEKINFWGRILQSLNSFLFGLPEFKVITKEAFH